jgi:SAM-dependent methyltransferase
MKNGHIITPWPPKQISRAYKQIAAEGNVLDVGCAGFRQVKIARAMGMDRLRHSGVDYCVPAGPMPENFNFKRADLSREKLPFADDEFDLVIASHIIEHVANPVEFFGDCLRVCKPGGLAYFEAPSERSLKLPGMPFNFHRFDSLSFYDDPTHCSRPWSPQAFYRLSKYYSCEPVRTNYLFSWTHRLLSPLTIPLTFIFRHKFFACCVWQTIGWASFVLVRKPSDMKGLPPFQYYLPE